MEHDLTNLKHIEDLELSYCEQLCRRIAALEAALASKPAMETIIEDMWAAGKFRLILAKRNTGLWNATWSNESICESAEGIDPVEAMQRAREKTKNPTIVRGPGGIGRTGAARPAVNALDLIRKIGGAG